MWNETEHSQEVYATDLIEAHVKFDQPISHELEYIEKDITRFYLTLKTSDTVISRITANKVLNELMTEAKDFRNGKFRFPISKAPDALSLTYHAAFAAVMAEKPAGTYPIEVSFETDNPLQQGKVLAQCQFNFILGVTDGDYLRQIAADNSAQGADKEEDPEAKKEFYDNLNKPKEKFDTVLVTLTNKGSGDIVVMAGYNSGLKYLVNYQGSVEVPIPASTELYRYENGSCGTNYGKVGATQASQVVEVY